MQPRTDVNHGSFSRSWIDHCLSSPTIYCATQIFFVDCFFTVSDHCHLHINIAVRCLPRNVTNDCSPCPKIANTHKVEMFQIHLRVCLGYTYSLRQNDNYNNTDHRNVLDRNWNEFKKLSHLGHVRFRQEK